MGRARELVSPVLAPRAPAAGGRPEVVAPRRGRAEDRARAASPRRTGREGLRPEAGAGQDVERTLVRPLGPPVRPMLAAAGRQKSSDDSANVDRTQPRSGAGAATERVEHIAEQVYAELRRRLRVERERRGGG
ncbi:MAG: hypothetical protein HY722_10140 [Planctomycetes bacterium]|nr:hypothetical protein [Planctomycetota bacterium]